MAAQLVLTWKGEALIDARTSIVDAQGVVLLDQGFDLQANQIIDVSGLANGNYFVVLQSSKGVAVKQFAKM